MSTIKTLQRIEQNYHRGNVTVSAQKNENNRKMLPKIGTLCSMVVSTVVIGYCTLVFGNSMEYYYPDYKLTEVEKQIDYSIESTKDEVVKYGKTSAIVSWSLGLMLVVIFAALPTVIMNMLLHSITDEKVDYSLITNAKDEFNTFIKTLDWEQLSEEDRQLAIKLNKKLNPQSSNSSSSNDMALAMMTTVVASSVILIN